MLVLNTFPCLSVGRAILQLLFFAVLPYTAIETFVYNPNCESHPHLNSEERRLIVFNRILKRFMNESVYYVSDSGGHAGAKLVASYADRSQLDVKDPAVQQRVLAGSIGPEYFPAELLATTFVSGRVRQMLGSSKKATNWGDLESREKTQGVSLPGDGEEGLRFLYDLHQCIICLHLSICLCTFCVDEGEEQPDDEFGGEDYAHNHYDDEDEPDDFMDDGGGGDDN